MPRAKKQMALDDPRLLEIAQAERQKFQNNKSAGCMFAFVLSTGAAGSHVAEPCYGKMKRLGEEDRAWILGENIETTKVAYFVHWPHSYRSRNIVKQWAHYPDGPMSDEERVFLTWFLNESPWSDGFVTKDAEDVFQHGAISRTDFPAAYIVAGGMGIRYLQYGRGVIEGFSAFVKDIPDPLERFLFSHWICPATASNSQLIGLKESPQFAQSYNVYSETATSKPIFNNILRNNREHFARLPLLREGWSHYYPTSKAWCGDNVDARGILEKLYLKPQPTAAISLKSGVKKEEYYEKDTWGSVHRYYGFKRSDLPALADHFLSQIRSK